MKKRSSPLGWVVVGVLSCALVVANTVVLRSDTDFAELGAYRRLWDDLARGVLTYLDREYPISPERAVRKTWAVDAEETTRRIIVEKAAQLDIRPWEFWRVIRDEAFLRERGRSLRVDIFDDPGRGLMLAAAFQLRGGIAPFLVLWLGPLLLLPVVMWTAYESFRARVPVFGALFLGLVGLSPFVLEQISFARSSAGFYLIALILLVPLALYGIVGPPPSLRGLLVRWIAGGVVFGLCTLCRSGSVMMLPALAGVLALSIARMAPHPRFAARPTMGRVLLAAAALLLFLTPYFALRQPEHHAVWAGIWQGLGDFDRTKGHSWSDPVAEEKVRSEGAPGLRTLEAAAILRDEVIDHVTDDPRWYVDILARRTAATFTLRKLWPSSRGGGLWMERSTSANEGPMDKYWAYTTTVDFIGFGKRRLELPIALVILPTIVLLGWAALEPSLRPGATVTLLMMAAALPLPVLISMAGGLEPQAFAISYGLGFAFLAEALIRRAMD